MAETLAFNPYNSNKESDKGMREETCVKEGLHSVEEFIKTASQHVYKLEGPSSRRGRQQGTAVSVSQRGSRDVLGRSEKEDHGPKTQRIGSCGDDVQDHRLQAQMQSSEGNIQTHRAACTNWSGDMHHFVLSSTVWAPMAFCRRNTQKICVRSRAVELEFNVQEDRVIRSTWTVEVERQRASLAAQVDVLGKESKMKVMEIARITNEVRVAARGVQKLQSQQQSCGHTLEDNASDLGRIRSSRCKTRRRSS